MHGNMWVKPFSADARPGLSNACRSALFSIAGGSGAQAGVDNICKEDNKNGHRQFDDRAANTMTGHLISTS